LCGWRERSSGAPFVAEAFIAGVSLFHFITNMDDAAASKHA
jgi:hypothetical protein